ncbi:hypothetical protein [Kitasatospora purpeofusca]|uniref:hypothetical protein n=1 Tax=Kitasatospora purpeofusca TaxID=67352 RepID=UPI0036D3BDFA
MLLSAAARSEPAPAVPGALVAFEAGEVDGADGSGWSVTVLGRADVSADAVGRDGPTAPDARPSDRVAIRIRPELVTGRLLPDAPAATVRGAPGTARKAHPARDLRRPDGAARTLGRAAVRAGG